MRSDFRNSLHNIILCFLLLFAVPFLSTLEAQEGQFFRGAERAFIQAETERLAALRKNHEQSILTLPDVIGMGVSFDAEKRSLVYLIVVDIEAETPDLPRKIEGVPVKVERRGREGRAAERRAPARPAGCPALRIPSPMCWPP